MGEEALRVRVIRAETCWPPGQEELRFSQASWLALV